MSTGWASREDHLPWLARVSCINSAPGEHLILFEYQPNHVLTDEWAFKGPDIPAQKVIRARAMTPALDQRRKVCGCDPADADAGAQRCCYAESTVAIMISLVTPIYNEEDLVDRLHSEVCAVFDTMDEDWEVVYVDDGSRDRSLPLLLELQDRDPHVVVVELSRNWGHQPAVTAGLSAARGDAIIIMDGDLQDPPKVIPELVQTWHRGAEVVIAERRSRAEPGIRKHLFPLFYKVLGMLSDYPIPLNTGVFGLMNRQVVDTILRLEETNRYLPGLRAWVGFKTEFVYYDRAGRASGEAKQTFGRLLKYALDAIFSFS